MIAVLGPHAGAHRIVQGAMGYYLVRCPGCLDCSGSDTTCSVSEQPVTISDTPVEPGNVDSPQKTAGALVARGMQ